MLDFINELISRDQTVTVHLNGTGTTLNGSFVKASDDALLLKTFTGSMCCVKIDSISYFEIQEETESENTVLQDDDNDEEPYSPAIAPKVVGKIDLDSIVDPRRRRSDNAFRQPWNSEENPPVPAGGTVTSIGPAFGFITTTDGESLFFSRAEIIQRHRGDEIQKGSHVIFTPGQNIRGGVARCVHVQISMQEQLEWIEKIQNYDIRNARMLAEQLLVAFPNDAELADTLNSLDVRPRRADSLSRMGVPVADSTLEAVRQGHYVEPADLLKAEREISASRPYGQAYSEIEELLRFAQTNSRQQCYQLFARLVKLARANGDDTNANALIGQALDFYADEAGAKAYFENLRRKATPLTPDEAVSKAQYKLLQSTRNNLLIVGSSPSTLGQITDSLHDVIANRQDCICAYIDLEEMPSDSSVSFASFFEIACQTTDDANTKFNLGFPMPDPDEYADLDEMNGPAKIAETLKSLRAAIAVHPDAPARLHLVTLFPDLSRLTTAPDSYPDDSGNRFFIRNLKRMADIAGTELQIILATTADREQALLDMPNASANLRYFNRIRS